MTEANIFELIDNITDHQPRVTVMRGVCHTAIARCIGSIRQHMRDQSRTERKELTDYTTTDIVTDIDQRNDFDENERAVEQINQAMGFDNTMSAFETAAAWHAVYDWAHGELETVRQNERDRALSFDEMISFMTERTQPLDNAVIKALLSVMPGVDEKSLRQMHELQDQQDRERLVNDMPTIKATFEGFASDGYEAEDMSKLPDLQQHQLGIKVYESLIKGKNRILLSVMRSKRIDQISEVPLFDAALKDVKTWIENFERSHHALIDEMLERGTSFKTLDDVK